MLLLATCSVVGLMRTRAGNLTSPSAEDLFWYIHLVRRIKRSLSLWRKGKSRWINTCNGTSIRRREGGSTTIGRSSFWYEWSRRSRNNQVNLVSMEYNLPGQNHLVTRSPILHQLSGLYGHIPSLFLLHKWLNLLKLLDRHARGLGYRVKP